MDKQYFMKVNGVMVEVSEEVYKYHHRSKRRALYLKERDLAHGMVFYSNMDTVELNGEENIPDLNSVTTEEAVIKKMLIKKLNDSFRLLSTDERELIHALFYEEYSERELAKKYNLSQVAIHKRKIKILLKLKTFLEK